MRSVLERRAYLNEIAEYKEQEAAHRESSQTVRRATYRPALSAWLAVFRAEVRCGIQAQGEENP